MSNTVGVKLVFKINLTVKDVFPKLHLAKGRPRKTELNLPNNSETTPEWLTPEFDTTFSSVCPWRKTLKGQGIGSRLINNRKFPSCGELQLMNGVAQSTWDIEIIWAILIVKLNKLKQWGIQVFIAPALLPPVDQDTEVDN